jgi:hypothetical protein
MKIIVDNVEDGDVVRYYYADLIVDDKQLSVSIEETYHTNPDFVDISNLEFLDGKDKFSEEELKEIENWLFDNSESWRGI